VGSLNLAAHLGGNPANPLDLALLRRTIAAAMRMLDNAIDISSYPDDATRISAEENRPVALGLCGFQDALDWLKAGYASVAAAEFADQSMEVISHCAILESANLAQERGAYPGYAASKWSQGLLPVDTAALAGVERGLAVDVDLSTTQDWDTVRDAVRSHGLRHCATTGISSTEEASKITGVSPSIEPFRQEWNAKARAVFEKEPRWQIECAARRQKWLDMSQSLTIYAADVDLTELADIVMQAWEKGLKTVRQFHLPERLSGGAAQSGFESAAFGHALQPKPEPAASR
jgi:ribonucleoside-diphosphate reductase alpha chain